jgi:molybdate transport system ATP-binding protein
VSAASSRYVEVRLKRIHLERGGRPVLHDIAWTVKPGERWVLCGGNGAGKTQLLKLVSGAVWPTPSGRESRKYIWAGETWATPADVKDEIAYVGPERQDKYERYGWNHTVTQVVGTGLYRTDIPLNPLTKKDEATIAALLKRIGIAHLATREFLTLSYGQRRLALLARALASNPKLLLLDELLAGLDESHRERAVKWLESTGRSQMPWVLATHRDEDVPHSATHALILDHGKIVYSGKIARAPLAKWLDHGEGSVIGARGASARDTRGASARDTRGASARDTRGASACDTRGASACDTRGATARDTRRTLAASTSLEGARKRPPSTGRHPARSTHSTRATDLLIKLKSADVHLDEYKALHSLTFEVRKGDCWVIHGSNGSGKTTLLRTLYGDHGVASHGSIERAGIVPGVPLQEFKVRAGFVAAHIQTIHPQHLTVDEIVQSGRHASIGLNDAPTAADRKAATKALEFFGLKGFGKRTRDELSYGQMRRVLFARAWVTHPRLLLLDEPLAGIDAPTRSVLLDRIGQLVAKGTAVVMTTHHRDEWPPYATHELELDAGRMKYAGPVREASAPARESRERPRRRA